MPWAFSRNRSFEPGTAWQERRGRLRLRSDTGLLHTGQRARGINVAAYPTRGFGQLCDPTDVAAPAFALDGVLVDDVHGCRADRRPRRGDVEQLGEVHGFDHLSGAGAFGSSVEMAFNDMTIQH
jgi:hypothetical protein